MRNRCDTEERRGRRRRHPLLRFLVRIVSAVLVISLTILFLPDIARLVWTLLPDTAGTAKSVSLLLRHRFEESARLETAQITDEGVLKTSQSALFFGEVLSEEVRYTYKASFGVNLTRAQVSVSGRAVTISLPEVELLLDSLTPDQVSRNDFWNPLARRSFGDRVKAEQERCRARYLDDPGEMEKLRRSALQALEKTVSGWIGGNSGVYIVYVWQEDGNDLHRQDETDPGAGAGAGLFQPALPRLDASL